MLPKNTNRSWERGLTEMNKAVKGCFMVLSLSISFCITGCGSASNEIIQTAKINSEVQHSQQSNHKAAEAAAETYYDIYEEAAEKGTLGDLEVVRSILNRLGANGYTAVDRENQMDMVCAEQAVQFCKRVEEKKEAELFMLSVMNNGGFIQYHFKASDGSVMITEGNYIFQSGRLVNLDVTAYPAYSWIYTEDGYLFFEEYHRKGYDGPSGHTAVRVQPLDEICRELNRKYMIPVGYELNDMFLSDWNEEDFGEISFYDLFDIFYPIVYEKHIPYITDENCGIGTIYQIPKEEFEEVIMRYFNIDSRILQTKTTYIPEDKSYEYRPRGLFDCEEPSYPYPEVVSYTENKDGTITLLVHAVYPDENTPRVYAHEVTVRPMADGSFQYVSNRIIPSKENGQETWHTNRLTEEEWEEYYEEN